MLNRIRALLPPIDKTKFGWFVTRCAQIRRIIKKLQEQDLKLYHRTQLELIGKEYEMSYTMQSGEVYQLARSLRNEEVFALPPGIFEPDVVEVDEETAGQMQYSGVLVYIKDQAVAIFTHPDDKNFVLGMVVDPNDDGSSPVPSEDEIPAETTADVRSITPEQMAEMDYPEDHVCECGYYIKDHMVDYTDPDVPALVCPSEG